MIKPATTYFIWLIWHTFSYDMSSGNMTSQYLNWNGRSKESPTLQVGHESTWIKHQSTLFSIPSLNVNILREKDTF